MRFSNFLFPECRDPARDGAVIDEVLQEVQLSEALGFDTVWLSEHHFDGTCAYVDPMVFAGAIAAATKRIKIGFAVAQMSLHHPVRMAEQLALLDHVSKGRLVVGLGRGTAYNVYEFQGYGIDPAEAQARFEESVEIILKAWTSEQGFTHQGRFWDLAVPVLRPRPFTRPHPLTIHAAASEPSLIELGRKGESFLMNVQNLATTASRIAAWRAAAREAGVAPDAAAQALDQSWVWRNVFVAETDAEAERIGIPAYMEMSAHRSAMRERMQAEQGIGMGKTMAKADPKQGLICGSPATVARHMDDIAATGVGGVILTFRMGPLSYADTARSLNLFSKQVAPRFRLQQAA